jgi:WD40 repeat protein
MRQLRLSVLIACLLILLASSLLVFSQDAPLTVSGTITATLAPAFRIEGEIGRALPRKMVYDPLNERMAVVDAYNRLLLINALDYNTLHILHDRGEYGDIAFSRDGRWLAVAYGVTMELWDANAGTLVGSLPDLGNARRLIGPITFSSNDEVVIFYGIYPAPRELRLTETDDITYPWVWHLPAARGEAASTFPNGLEAVQMVDYANGFVLSPDDKIVAALPARLRVLDVFTLQPEYEIPTTRYEQDALTAWYSLLDNSLYVRPVTTNTLLQVDTQRGVLVEIPMNTPLTPSDLDLIGGIELGSIGQVIGAAASRDDNPLLGVFLGNNYRHPDLYGNKALTITLIDLVLPPAATRDNVLAVLYVYDEAEGTGTFIFGGRGTAQQMVLSPDRQNLLVRLYGSDENVVTFDVASGQELRRFIPSLRAIGGYSREGKNRVLAYDTSGAFIISDFERRRADTSTVEVEDLRYSRNFDRFFFSNDSRKIITLAGTEWREWDVETGEVLRRDLIYLNGQIVATSSDGYRYLTIYNSSYGAGAQVIDMNSGESYIASFSNIPGSSIIDIYANPSWTRFLVIYSENSYGPYYPGNQIAIYDYQDGLKTFIAGDDLPPVGQRLYGWVDDDTAYVYGQGRRDDIPSRIYDVDYAVNGLPRCVADAYPAQQGRFLQLWERLVYNLRADQLDGLSSTLCANLPSNATAVEANLILTATPQISLATGLPTGEVPQCLLDRYPGQAEEYSATWRSLVGGLSQEEAQELAVMLCDGIGVIDSGAAFDPSLGYTMFINASTGERASGDYQRPMVETRPLDPIYRLFEETEKRSLGTAILSPDEQLVAASSLPGELIIYRMLMPYRNLTAQLTATIAAELQAANLIKAQPTPSPTYNSIGTPRPTLTPTPEQTLYPRPQERAFSSTEGQVNFCPSEKLFTVDNLPVGYDAAGRIYAEVQGDYLWVVEPENGTRAEDQDILQCGRGVGCEFSPDHQWILAESYESIFIIRPDNSDPRVLWNLLTPNPPTPPPYDIYWSGNRAIEWQADIPVTVAAPTPYTTFRQAYIRDVLNVFPDPRPWVPEVSINELPTELITRQPGGSWAIVSTSYNTGLGQGYKYYLYDTNSDTYQMFAQSNYNTINVYWHPWGDRLFYNFPGEDRPPTYQVTFPDISHKFLGYAPSGSWSNDGRYIAYYTNSLSQPIGVWDSQTGQIRTYCLPETGARGYGGSFIWSPDNRYIALQAPLPKDESKEGVGQHTLILSVTTGEVVDLTTGLVQIIAWSQEPGTYGDGRVVTPTITVTMTPSLTATPTQEK